LNAVSWNRPIIFPKMAKKVKKTVKAAENAAPVVEHVDKHVVSHAKVQHEVSHKQVSHDTEEEHVVSHEKVQQDEHVVSHNKRSRGSQVLITCCFLLSIPVAVIAVLCASLQVSAPALIAGVVMRGLETMHTMNPDLDPTPGLSVQAKSLHSVFRNAQPFRTYLNRTQDTIFMWRTAHQMLGWMVPSDPSCSVEETFAVGGTVPVKRIWKKDGSKPDGTIFYVHGGGYVYGDYGVYKSFVCKLAQRTNFEVIYTEYPLAPDYGHNVQTQFRTVYNVIKERGYVPKRTLMVSDSAGSNIAILVARRLWFDRMPNMAALGFISPFVDFMPEHHSNYFNEKKDLVLSRTTVGIMAVNAIANNITLIRDDCCNGFQFSWTRFPPVVVTGSDTEILFGDSWMVENKCKNHHVPVDRIEGKNMMHNWLLADGYMPEATAAVDDFVMKLLRHTELAQPTNDA
jgi:acetyl esterase/lipase